MSDDLISQLQAALGPKGVLTDPQDVAPYLTDWRRCVSGRTPCLVRPANTAEVAAAVRLCRQAGTSIVPQGGNTGLAAGAIPDDSGTQVLLSLQRMARIRDVDVIGLTIEVEAGCVLSAAKLAAHSKDLLLPISFAAEGSATIGGVVSTNAGGVNVLRYGMTRTSVLGLEVVLSDGTVVSGLRRLRKNNAGYDWKQLFIGSEGTLGIVTAAMLRLMPRPRENATALLAVGSPQQALELLGIAQSTLGDQISAFELISPVSISLLDRALSLALPFETEGWVVLIEAASNLLGLRDGLETMMERAFEQGVVSNGVVAESQAQAAALWTLREQITEAEAKTGPSLKHDISVPISLIPQFLDAAGTALAAFAPELVINIFGHMGDGNIHYNVLINGTRTSREINRIVHSIVIDLGGSISAEHGIGSYRLEELEEHLASEEMALARLLKRALDPCGLLNPGKVLLSEERA